MSYPFAKYLESSLLLQEIAQQPELWEDTLQRVDLFLSGREKFPKRVILTGAGTSAYAGQSVASAWPGACAIATTDLMLLSSAEIESRLPGVVEGGLLISIARSGDSPESAGVVQRFKDLFPAVRHLVITCNAEGRLAQMPDVDVLTLSPRTNDRSLAMTGSFSSLTLAGLALMHLDVLREHLPKICVAMRNQVESMFGIAQEMVSNGASRFVVLTSIMPSLSTETTLKVMELTAGRNQGMTESFLGFRHGANSILRAEIPVLCFVSSDPLKRRYESELVYDLRQRGIENVCLVGQDEALSWPHRWWVPSLAPLLADVLRVPFEVVFAQLFAYASSVQAGVDPDDPSPGGEVTRVVRPFQVHA